jgi:hypothetical protein
MPTVTLSENETLHVSRALRDALAEASITHAAHAARVFDHDQAAALVVITDGELAFVTRRGVRRWKPDELAWFDGGRIVPITGDPVEIVAWHEEAQRTSFLRAARNLIGQAEPAPAALGVPRAPHVAPAPLAPWVLAAGVAPMAATVGGLGSATWIAREAKWDSYNEIFGYFLFAAFILSLPLLIASIKLIRRESEWMPIGIVGAAVGAAGAVAIILLVLFVIAWGLACGSEGCLR